MEFQYYNWTPVLLILWRYIPDVVSSLYSCGHLGPYIQA